MLLTAFLGILFVAFCTALSVGGLLLVRRSARLGTLESHHEVAGFFIGVLSVIYSVLLAFVVFLIWGQFEDAKRTVAREANQLGDLMQMTRVLPPANAAPIQKEILAYGRLVVEREWPAMSKAQSSQEVQAQVDLLWNVILGMQPTTAKDVAVFERFIDRLTELSDSRRLRLHVAHDRAPLLIWVLLIGGGILNVSFTYFFGLKSVRAQALMTAALTMEIAFVLFLILALDHPFAGGVSVSPKPMEEFLVRHQVPSQ